jgi:hypothetical protein
MLKDTQKFSEPDVRKQEVREVKNQQIVINNSDLFLTSEKLERGEDRSAERLANDSGYPVTPATCGDCPNFLIKKGWIGCTLVNKQWRELGVCPLKDINLTAG